MNDSNPESVSEYVVTLVRKGRTTTQCFARLVDAIRFLRAEFDTGDGYTERGEIHQEGILLWRRVFDRKISNVMKPIDPPQIQDSKRSEP